MVRKILDVIEKILSLIMIALFSAVTLVMFYQVVLRYVFKTPNIWPEEFARFGTIWMCSLGSAVCFRRYKHITITMISDTFPVNFKRFLDVIIYVLMAIFICFVFYQGILFSVATLNVITPGLRMKQGIVFLCIPISAFLMFVFICECIFDKVKKIKLEFGKVNPAEYKEK